MSGDGIVASQGDVGHGTENQVDVVTAGTIRERACLVRSRVGVDLD